MVGIVLVSHSPKLAEGAAELAREMGGADVRLEAVGGLDLPERPIGTDAVLVSEAIERAWSEDGVLVLMDLGSAVLSAEMALDMLPQDRRDRVLLCEAPFVEGAVAAAVAAKLGSSLQQVAGEARGGLGPKASHLGAPTGEGAPSTTSEEAREGPEQATRLVVDNPLGLHARPAARFVQTAGRFDAEVRVSNLTTGRGPASARSLNAVATLGVLHGHEIEVTARGPQAADAIGAIRALAADRFGDAAAEAELVPAAARPTVEGAITGSPASPGVAVGPARHFRPPKLAVPSGPPGEPKEEWAAFEKAVERARNEIRATREQVAARAGEQSAAIFDAHLLFLDDEELIDPVRTDVLDHGEGAARAWNDAIERTAAEWRALGDPYLEARAADVEAVGAHVLALLAGHELASPTLFGSGVLIAPDLTPADTAGLDPSVVQGIATSLGGPTSHSAVLARSLGIPAVVGLGEAALGIAEGTTVIVDGEGGTLLPSPGPTQPAVTIDGTSIEVLANVGKPEDIAEAIRSGAEGVGLLRTEFLFVGRDTMPSEDEQEVVYREMAEALGGRPMILRTLDVGGDKPLAYLPVPPEANPFLGLRGLRLGLERPDILLAQLRAVLRVAEDHPVKVMFPMVSSPEELHSAKALLGEASREVARERGRVLEPVDVGIMVEVPSAALSAAAFAPEVDFFSIGTNDLTQYTLAAERGNLNVAQLSDALHPAVLRLIRMTVEAAEPLGRTVGVCGEVAADPLAVPILVGLGVRELSAAAPAVPRVKRAVRETELGAASALAERALSMESAVAVRAAAAR